MPLQTVDVCQLRWHRDELMYELETMLPFGDAKESLARVVAAVKALQRKRQRDVGAALISGP